MAYLDLRAYTSAQGIQHTVHDIENNWGGCGVECESGTEAMRPAKRRALPHTRRRWFCCKVCFIHFINCSLTTLILPHSNWYLLFWKANGRLSTQICGAHHKIVEVGCI